MSILALETSGDMCSLAIAACHSQPLQRRFPHEMQLLRNLTAEVDALLAQAGLKLPELAGIAVNVGPGSYTGLRIGVTTAKVWALALKLRVWAVSGLHAQACSACDGLTGPILSVLPARQGHVYAAVYDGVTCLQPQTLLAPGLYEEGKLAELVPSELEAIVCPIGNGVSGLRDRARHVRQGALDATAIATIGAARRRHGDGDTPLELAPLYLAEPRITAPGGARSGG